MLDDKKLDFYISHDYNVLMRGRHGVGKTALIKQAFERNNLNWKYFSASTMDPWVDFVGIPKEVREGDKSYIELIRPKNFQNDEVEAIFLDEFNRAKAKVRNAVMELIQFKSINGVPFRNLRMVWCAINPEDDEQDLKYDVEELDEAQRDRFQIILDIPYQPDRTFFIKKFGKEIGSGAIEWWKALTPEQNILVSPRRLDFALQVHMDGGDLRDVLPNKQLNLEQLRVRIEHGSIAKKLENMMDQTDEECMAVFNNINFQTDAIPHIIKRDDYLAKYGKFINRDKLSDLVTQDDMQQLERIVKNVPDYVITPVLVNIVQAGNVSRSTVNNIRNIAKQHGLDLTSETTFTQSVKEALDGVADIQNRYTGLQAVFANFNRKASITAYSDVVKFMAMLFYYVQEASLKDSKKPYHQLGVEVVHMTDIALTQNHNTSFKQVWSNLKTSDKQFKNFDDARMKKVEEMMDYYLKSTPKLLSK